MTGLGIALIVIGAVFALIVIIAVIVAVVLATSDSEHKPPTQSRPRNIEYTWGDYTGSGGDYTQELNKIKGEEGERRVAEALSSEKCVLNQVRIKDERDDSLEIDHVCINTHGIWVIETKNWSGEISGEKDDAYWTQVCGDQIHRHRNPIKQNQAHISRLKQCMNIRERVFHNVVVFAGNAEVLVDADEWCYLSALMTRISSSSEVYIPPNKVVEYYNQLNYLNNKLGVSESEHVANIKRKHGGSSKYCPKCGAELTTKYGADGTYLICGSGRCDYFEKIDDGWDY